MKKENLELAINLRHELHAHPELSNQETWTKAHVIDVLKKNTSLEIIDRGLWFYAVYRAGKGKANIAFRADFDAIPVMEGNENMPYRSQFPGISHKCGHDGHTATLAAFALEIDRIKPDKNVFFLFQHAEETGDGAALCQAFIGEEGIDEIFGFHNQPGFELNTIVLRNGTMNCASTGMSIYFEGKNSHASMPEAGINPAFAIGEIIGEVPKLIEKYSARGLVLCTVVNVVVGEEAYGVSPGTGVLRMTCRGQFEDDMNALIADIEQLAKEKCARDGMTYRVEFKDSFPETANHASSADKIRKVAKKLGLTVEEAEKPHRGSEDYGHYTKQIPGAMLWVGNGFGPPVHTKEYDFNDGIIEKVVEVYMALLDEC